MNLFVFQTVISESDFISVCQNVFFNYVSVKIVDTYEWRKLMSSCKQRQTSQLCHTPIYDALISNHKESFYKHQQVLYIGLVLVPLS